MGLRNAVLIGLVFAMATPAVDVIFDKDGNEIECTVLSVTEKEVAFKTDTARQAPVKTLEVRRLFMVKYGDGRKIVFKNAAGPRFDSDFVKTRNGATLLFNGGFFGLFNVDSALTYAKYTAGVTPMVEFRLHRMVSIGAESMILMGKPNTGDAPRLLVNPNIRAKALIAIAPKLLIGPVISAGVTFWPHATGTAYIDSTFLDDRFGWDARAAIGIEYLLTTHLSIAAEIGYSASSSESRGVWITHDMMLAGIGPKVNF